jgi:TetR/AcrR family transcriptional regulator, transcriptional repressor for nem operon
LGHREARKLGAGSVPVAISVTETIVSEFATVTSVARTKTFDPDAAVERAMQTFWAHGYEATSAQDLVDALQINRSSLYSTFSSKGELYRRALARYGETSQGWTAALHQGSGDFRSRLRRALVQAVDEDLDPTRSRGCFACNAAVELGPADPEVRRLVGAAFDSVRTAFRDALIRAERDGELAAESDVDALAALLVCVLEGLHVVAKGTRDRETVEQAIDSAVAAL